MRQVSLDLRFEALVHGCFCRRPKSGSVRGYRVLTLLYDGGKVRPASGSVIGPVYNTMRDSRWLRGVLMNSQ
jgi:hypothetical protein